MNKRKLREFARNLYLTPNVVSEPAYNITEIISQLDLKFPELAGKITEDTIFAWANRSEAGEATWADIRGMSQSLRITSNDNPGNAPWIEVITSEYSRQANVAASAARMLKFQAIGWMADHYKDGSNFTSIVEALAAFKAADSILRDQIALKLPQK